MPEMIKKLNKQDGLKIEIRHTFLDLWDLHFYEIRESHKSCRISIFKTVLESLQHFMIYGPCYNTTFLCEGN